MHWPTAAFLLTPTDYLLQSKRVDIPINIAGSNNVLHTVEYWGHLLFIKHYPPQLKPICHKMSKWLLKPRDDTAVEHNLLIGFQMSAWTIITKDYRILRNGIQMRFL